MSRPQIALILGLGVLGLIVPSFTLGLCLECAAVGAYLAIVLSD